MTYIVVICLLHKYQYFNTFKYKNKNYIQNKKLSLNIYLELAKFVYF